LRWGGWVEWVVRALEVCSETSLKVNSLDILEGGEGGWVWWC
jgi:hypothetical protein